MKVSHFIPHASPPPSTHKLPHPAFFFQGHMQLWRKREHQKRSRHPKCQGRMRSRWPKLSMWKCRPTEDTLQHWSSPDVYFFNLSVIPGKVSGKSQHFDWQMDTPDHSNYQDQKALTTERPRKTLLVIIWKGKPVPLCCGGIVKTTNSFVK